MTKEIPLTRGYVAIIDDESYALVSGYTWRAKVEKSGTVYAMAHIHKPDGKKTSVPMHRMIMGVTDPKVHVDHINGDGIDNRRSNMRLCTSAQNSRNRGAQKGSASGVKGVSWHQNNQKWRAQIAVDGRVMHLGGFDTKDDAARAYQIAAIKYHGEFARLS